jgi:hypothetical protein
VLAAALLAFTFGCGGGTTGGGGDDKKDGGEDGKTELKPVDIKGRGTLKGTVTVADLKPDIIERLNKEYKENLEKAKSDKEHCLMQVGENTQQTWLVDDKGNLKNVIVWVAPPDGHYFKLEDKDRDLKSLGIDAPTIDQPHCAFHPRALALFQSYYDPKTKKHVETGQKLTVKNSGNLTHNTTWSAPGITGDNQTVGAGKHLEIKPANLTRTGLRPPASEITFSCQVHPWMRAYARDFDHPFAAVSDEHGAFEIKDVPAGSEVRIMYWHESMKTPKELKKVTLKDGGTEDVKITISAQ